MSIYNDFPIDSKIWQVSNPEEVRANYHKKYKNYIDLIKKHYNVDSEIYPSSRADKKYMIFGLIKNNDLGMIHFGSIDYEDFTKHKDNKRRERYLKRFNKDDMPPYSPYMLSKLLLW